MQTMEQEVSERIETWKEFDLQTKQCIEEMSQEQLQDAFYQNLTFGTGGLRGLMGVGCNRMNLYTVAFATQGLAEYLVSQYGTGKVFIGYDTRLQSEEFAQKSAQVLAGNGFEVILSHQICPTPVTSYACRQLGCIAAIMVTASHNPSEYNGYKVYWGDGGQVLPPHDQHIVAYAAKISSPEQVKQAPFDSKNISRSSDALFEQYIKELETFKTQGGQGLHVVYTNLHGTGRYLVPRALEAFGVSQVSLVTQQATLDGHFPTAPVPNPELPEALALGMETLQELKADILIATDPDADRMRVCLFQEGEPVLLTGNQIACLLLDHVLSSTSRTREDMVIKTIVTTELFQKIAHSYGVECLDVLTGFKYIAQTIHREEGRRTFLFGGEESYGTLRGTYARDKDAIIASALIAELAAKLKRAGKTLKDRMDELFAKHGLAQETLRNLHFSESQEGHRAMKEGMDRLRTQDLKTLGGVPIAIATDFLHGIEKNYVTHTTSPSSLPSSNVLRFDLEDGSKVLVRPSGTEPKVKIYTECFSTNPHAQQTLQQRGEALCDELAQFLC